ncbi:HIRAN domain-containing protein [Dechloromonas denitrificans]|uniref:HIRAN domain-containing protein n=1 Tax=Dechloromonas denitrificans TaxID=281362 RepID=UPI001CF8F492|nr:HIRAN domain-containing protein [Dechloromonas denitrificans]UCV03111.1 HIRAN domain-containing protein [Dechloromonas denitrificans]UCV07430.1 HIRAN domain-containing protein [Dechloromonas denitrificans]
MRLLLTISLLFWLAPAAAESVRLLIQSSPLAGSQYYAVGEQWSQMRVGDRLDLVREPDNRHDRNAIRVEWRGHQLGYVPRRENRMLAAAMDQGERLVARIAKLREDANPWQRVEFEVFIEL